MLSRLFPRVLKPQVSPDRWLSNLTPLSVSRRRGEKPDLVCVSEVRTRNDDWCYKSGNDVERWRRNDNERPTLATALTIQGLVRFTHSPQ